MTPLHEDVQRTHAALQEIRNLQTVLQEDLRRVHAALALEAATTRERMLANLQSAQLEAAKDGRAAAERMEHEARALREAIAREQERSNAVLLAALRQLHHSAASPHDRPHPPLDRV